ncbi:helix-turn-helix domain-containing protein [Herbidospora galbida]|nr:helix-turn-helix domain-containing protein [Herbidospora galbida]
MTAATPRRGPGRPARRTLELTEPMWTLEDVATYLNVKHRWLQNNWKTVGIPMTKVGNQLRCFPTDLAEWLEQQAA